jgi:hypothetical protein
LVRLATGSGYGVSTGMLVAFALLGTAWSVTQVLLLAAVAIGDRRPSRLLWGLIATEAAVVAIGLHDSPGQILAASTVAVLLFTALISALEWTARPAGAPTPAVPVSAVPVSAAPVSAAPVSAAPVSAAPVSAAPVSAADPAPMPDPAATAAPVSAARPGPAAGPERPPR